MGGQDIRTGLLSIYNLIRSSSIKARYTSPCESLVLKAHYRWTFLVFILCFFIIWHGWYHERSIVCASHYDASATVRMDYINICLSYPFVENGDEKRYLLFYRWIHYVFLLLAALYYVPRKVSKLSENSTVKSHLETLTNQNCENFPLDSTAKYFEETLHTHNGLYFKFVFVHFLAIIINILGMKILDFVLQERFFELGWKSYPFQRDPDEYTDYISLTFPPFANCSLGKAKTLVGKRQEKLGCHLTFMELYEKIFLILWMWLSLLLVASILHLVFYTSIFPYLKGVFLKPTKPRSQIEKRERDILPKVFRVCKIGDIYLLFCFKQYLSHNAFFDLLIRISGKVSSGEDLLTSAPPGRDTSGGGDIIDPEKEMDSSKSIRKRNLKGKDPRSKGHFGANIQKEFMSMEKSRSPPTSELRKSPAPPTPTKDVCLDLEIN